MDTDTRDAIEASHVDTDALVGWMDDTGSDDVDDAEDRYLGYADSLTEWAEQYADDTGMLDGIPSDLRYYFDYEAWMRDATLGGELHVVSTPDGRVHVFHN